VNGIVVGEDGKKLSKRLKNYPDPMEVFEKYGADALRYYLTSSPVMAAENLSFKESDVVDLVRGMFRMLWNSYSFFVLYASIDKFKVQSSKFKFQNLLDKWVISELNVLAKEVNSAMENYELNRAARYFPKFIDNLSNWYIRRSRKRFWKSEDDKDKKEAYQTLYYVLTELSKLMAPFTPFIAEEIYKNLTGEESVHLVSFPVADEKLIDEKLNGLMDKTRDIVSLGLQLRAQAKIKVRQPISELKIINFNFQGQTMKDEIESIIREELNVKIVSAAILKNDNNWVTGEIRGLKIAINTEITKDLKLEGQAREIIRFIQEMRKEAGYEVDNRIEVGYSGISEAIIKCGDLIKKEVLALELRQGKLQEFDLEKEFMLDGEKVKIQIKL
jgi:isoleucyl-tRNA synthetase